MAVGEGGTGVGEGGRGVGVGVRVAVAVGRSTVGLGVSKGGVGVGTGVVVGVAVGVGWWETRRGGPPGSTITSCPSRAARLTSCARTLTTPLSTTT
jgi:hypothetical protein